MLPRPHVGFQFGRYKIRWGNQPNYRAIAECHFLAMLNLETAVGREKDVQDIDVHGGYEKLVVTLLAVSYTHLTLPTILLV